jgi:hypothetical protein
MRSSRGTSVVAAQGSGTLAPFHAANNYRIALAEPGVVPAAAMFRDKAEEEALWTWIWRAVGFVLMLFGFVLMANPLSVLVGVIPLFEELVGIASFLLALIVAAPLALIVIAAAWIAHRPLVGAGLLVAGLGLGYLVRRLHRRPAQPPPPPRRTSCRKASSARGAEPGASTPCRRARPRPSIRPRAPRS